MILWKLSLVNLCWGGIIVSNIALLILLSVVCVKTDILKKVMVRLGVIECKATDAPDYYAIFSWTNMLKKMGYDSDVVFFGDSITRGSDFQEFFPNHKVVNLGYSGDDIVRAIRRVDQIKALKPEKVFLLMGINGLSTKSNDDFRSQYTLLVDSISHALPSSKLYLQSILPVNQELKAKSVADNSKILDANKIIKDISIEKDMVYVDLYSKFCLNGELPDSLTIDGIHLMESSYRYWADAIQQYIE